MPPLGWEGPVGTQTSHCSSGFPVIPYIARAGFEYSDTLPSAVIIGTGHQAQLITFHRTWVRSAHVTRVNQLQFTQLPDNTNSFDFPSPTNQVKGLHKSTVKMVMPKLPLASIIKITSVSREFTELSGLFMHRIESDFPHILDYPLQNGALLSLSATEWGWQYKIMGNSHGAHSLGFMLGMECICKSYCWQDLKPPSHVFLKLIWKLECILWSCTANGTCYRIGRSGREKKNAGSKDLKYVYL